MSVYERAAEAWGMVNAGVDGHLAELDVLHANAPDADQLTYGLLGEEPCVVGAERGRVVVATQTGFQWADGPAVYGRYGSSFRLSAGALTVSHLGRPACEAIVGALTNGTPGVQQRG